METIERDTRAIAHDGGDPEEAERRAAQLERAEAARTLAERLAVALEGQDDAAPLWRQDDALVLLEQVRWPDGPICPACGATDPTRVRHRRGRFQCTTCKRGYSVRGGTVLEGSTIALDVWVWTLRHWSGGRDLADLGTELGADRMTPHQARKFADRLTELVALPEEPPEPVVVRQPTPPLRRIGDVVLALAWVVILLITVSGDSLSLRGDDRLQLEYKGIVERRGAPYHATWIGNRRRFYTPVGDNPEASLAVHLDEASQLRLIMIQRDREE